MITDRPHSDLLEVTAASYIIAARIGPSSVKIICSKSMIFQSTLPLTEEDRKNHCFPSIFNFLLSESSTAFSRSLFGVRFKTYPARRDPKST